MIFDLKRRLKDDDTWYLIGEIAGAINAAKKNPLHDVILSLPNKYKTHADIILNEMSPFEEAAFRIQTEKATLH